MLDGLHHDLETSVYDAPAFAFRIEDYMSVPEENVEGDNLVIPVVLTGFNPPNTKAKVTNVPLIPILDESSGMAFGGTTLFEGAQELAKLTLEGQIDTPCVTSGSYRVPDMLVNGVRLTYGEFMLLCVQGRMSGDWKKIDPLWFRDPYGRRYTRPVISELSANFVEAVPGRTTITATMVV